MPGVGDLAADLLGQDVVEGGAVEVEVEIGLLAGERVGPGLRVEVAQISALYGAGGWTRQWL